MFKVIIELHLGKHVFIKIIFIYFEELNHYFFLSLVSCY